MKYSQDHPTFKSHVRHLIDMTRKVRGPTPYWFKTEAHDSEDDVTKANWVSCGKCSHPVSMEDECKFTSTGYITILDNIKYTKCCGPSLDPKLVGMVCVACARVALYLTPHKNETGFEYRAGEFLHIDSCSECCGRGGLKSMIIEQVVFNNLNNTKSLDSRVSKD